MMLYRIHTKQKLPIDVEEAWSFLSNPANLALITPDSMGFDIISGADRPMFPGQIIQYYVRPMAGLKIRWVTEITHVVKHRYFVDEQRFGPYTLWHHKHFINPVDGGVEMEDIVDYKLPFGILGRLMHNLMVKKKLQQIFKYREEKLTELFGRFPNTSKVIQMN
ncbi:cell division inhibitor [Leptobacterium flavescens]|uniref:Cell division inhibitor n=1 Tax=Leptobacterium flavescens TaxID=472055 RepID=A0A6P0UH03_9FLAO|nr:SRPBCC family protein [Leptobacterium flavescens]NER11912.1 cell division inhibitor [Leptobacterium flavescens]